MCCVQLQTKHRDTTKRQGFSSNPRLEQGNQRNPQSESSCKQANASLKARTASGSFHERARHAETVRTGRSGHPQRPWSRAHLDPRDGGKDRRFSPRGSHPRQSHRAGWLDTQTSPSLPLNKTALICWLRYMQESWQGSASLSKMLLLKARFVWAYCQIEISIRLVLNARQPHSYVG